MLARASLSVRQHICMCAGYGSGDNNNQAIITPVMAVGTSSGTIYLQNVSTLQAGHTNMLCDLQT